MSNCSFSLSAKNVDHAAHTFWTQLWDRLVQWLRRRTKPPVDAEDLAAETVLSAVQNLGHHPERPWPVVWSWARNTAKNLACTAARSAGLLALASSFDLDQMQLRERSPLTTRASLLHETLWSVANPSEERLLLLTGTGMTTPELARAFEVTPRTVERFRRNLRMRASHAAGFLPDHVGAEGLY